MVASARRARTLTHAEARAFYDRFVELQDWQHFYEDAAAAELIRRGDFSSARAVLELGCGTGRLAERLLTAELPPDASYLGLDVSVRMVERTRRRLARFGPRAKVVATDGSLRLRVATGSHDRFVAAYVLDLLSEPDIRLALNEAHRILVPGGRLCTASLSAGSSPSSRLVARVWTAIHHVAPIAVGGCRPIDVRAILAADAWHVSFSETVVSFAVPTQVVVATARKAP